MAKIFWIQGKDALLKARVGYYLLKKLKRKIDKTNTELVNKIQKCLNEWSDIDVGLLSECQAMNEQKTQELPVHELLCCMFCPILAILVLTFTSNIDAFSKVEQRHDHEKAGNAFVIIVPVTCGMGQKPSEQWTSDRQHITPRKKLYYFFTAPVIICMYNVLSYVVFMSTYVFVLIFNFGSTLSPPDIALIVYVFAFLMGEVRQVTRSVRLMRCCGVTEHIHAARVMWAKPWFRS
ncbi:hypothetical protein DPMN_179941 [Dreissena polymorpha]|uniref:TRPM-like domain-containing protein n=1 Tax=Dreissena polymorpha TaxID=45954 RepID=A0A9D4EDS6_DREPO|nr:hypothetical protein DPMN_179941 [Dreissena polymorpha]